MENYDKPLSGFLEQFNNPPNECRVKPFWFWNGKLDEDELIRQIKTFKDMGLGGFFVHGRFGLETPYLSEEWFNALKITVNEAESLGLEVWLYDENLFPSGIGNTQISKNIRYRSKFIEYNTFRVMHDELGFYIPADALPEGGKLFSVQIISDEVQQILPFNIKQSKIRFDKVSSEEITLFWTNTIYDSNNMIFGVDYLNPEMTSEFIKSTHEVYKNRFGKWFGTVIKGFFTDEPTLLPWHHDLNWYVKRGNGRCIPYTENLLKEMKIDGAAGITPDLLAGAVFFDCGDIDHAGEIRKAYYKTVSRLYTENFFGAYSKWCEANSLMLTGHVLLEEGLYFNHIFQSGPLTGLSQMHVPGVDQLTSKAEFDSMSYMVGNSSHMPKVKTNITGPKLVSSLAHTSGKRQVISECFGIGGWGMQFDDMKAILNWLYSLGVNRLCPHAFFYSIEGYRKNDAPPCHYHNSNAVWYNNFADYAARMSWAMSQGSPVADTAVVYPESAFRYNFSAGRQRENDKRISDIYDLVCCGLQDIHRNYEILTEVQIASAVLEDRSIILGDDYTHSTIKGVMSEVSHLRFSTIICPSLQALDISTAEMLDRFKNTGGKLLVFDGNTAIDRDTGFKWEIESENKINRSGISNILKEFLGTCESQNMRLHGENNTNIYSLCRKTGHGNLWLFVNTDNKNIFDGYVSFTGSRIIRMDAETGECCVINDGKIHLTLAPTASVLILEPDDNDNTSLSVKCADPSRIYVNKKEIDKENWNFNILGYNTLPVNKWNFEIFNEGMGSRYIYTKNIYSEHETDDVFIVLDDIEYRSSIMGKIDFSVSVNGIECKYSGWHIDKGFKKFKIGRIVKGENTIKIEMCHSSWSGEPHLLTSKTFIIGRFGLKKTDNEWTVIPEITNLSLNSWTSQGYALYSGQAAYSKYVSLPDWDNMVFELERVDGSAQLIIDGEDMGIRLWAPWRWDIPATKSGKNVELKLVVTNTLANYLGEECVSGPCGKAVIKQYEFK